jgi:hypothetical protein
VAASTPSRVLESRFTSTYCPSSRELFTKPTTRMFSPLAPRKAFSSEGESDHGFQGANRFTFGSRPASKITEAIVPTNTESMARRNKSQDLHWHL